MRGLSNKQHQAKWSIIELVSARLYTRYGSIRHLERNEQQVTDESERPKGTNKNANEPSRAVS